MLKEKRQGTSLPLLYFTACIDLSNQVESQSEDNESKSDPLGCLCKLSVQSLSLALGEEGVSAAGDSTGKAGTLAALEEHDNGKSNTAENLNNSKNDSKSRHLFQSFRLLNA